MAANIPDLPRIVAFRNVLIHGYASVDERLVWGVVESGLAPLLAASFARLLALWRGSDPAAMARASVSAATLPVSNLVAAALTAAVSAAI